MMDIPIPLLMFGSMALLTIGGLAGFLIGLAVIRIDRYQAYKEGVVIGRRNPLGPHGF